MNTREIIQGLTICTRYGTMGGQNCRGHFEYAETEKGFDIVRKDNHNDECPYDGCKTGCVVTLATDAAAALKAYAEARTQEPRVLGFWEIEYYTAVWLEDRDKKDLILAVCLEDKPNEKRFTRAQANGDYIVGKKYDYMKRWRAWDEEPQRWQREAAKWDEP